MKTTYFSVLILLMAVMTSCYDFDWNFDHETTLSKIEIISSEQSVDITVNYTDSTTNLGREIRLEWDASKAADHSKVFYEVLFYNNSQSLDSPFYKMITGFGQIENFLILNEKELNIIAEKAGIPQKKSGSIIWKVRASNGINELFSANYQTINISRPDGFAYYPDKMLIEGAAIGTDMSLELKKSGQKEAGEYELFFYLAEGNFYLTEKGSERRFYISQDGKISELFGSDKESLTNTPITTNKIHRLKVNFKKSTATIVAIESVGVWYSGTNSVLGEMQQENEKVPYWSLVKKLELISVGGFPDYRYKFRIDQKNMKGENSFSFWGYSSLTAPNQGENTQSNYFYLYEVDSSQSNYCFKFSRTDHDQHELKIDADFRPETDYFKHSITQW